MSLLKNLCHNSLEILIMILVVLRKVGLSNIKTCNGDFTCDGGRAHNCLNWTPPHQNHHLEKLVTKMYYNNKFTSILLMRFWVKCPLKVTMSVLMRYLSGVSLKLLALSRIRRFLALPRTMSWVALSINSQWTVWYDWYLYIRVIFISTHVKANPLEIKASASNLVTTYTKFGV